MARVERGAGRSRPTEVAERWLREVYRPTLARIAAVVGPDRDLVQAYCDVLEQKWLLSEQEGRDVGLAAAIDSYLDLGAPAPEAGRDGADGALDPLDVDRARALAFRDDGPAATGVARPAGDDRSDRRRTGRRWHHRTRDDQRRPAADPSSASPDLHKRYGETRAVDGVSFEVRPGRVFGLLGPNGAGKTTTVEMLEGLR